MKLVHVLNTPALLLALCGAVSAQMPGQMPYGQMPGPMGYGPGPQNGRPVSFADPMPGGGSAPLGADIGAPMQSGADYGAAMPDMGVPGAQGGFQGEDAYGTCQPSYGGPSSIRARCGYGYLSMDALYWDRDTGFGNAIARQTTNTSVVLLAGDDLNYDFDVLPRLTGGYVLRNGLAVEGTYFYKDDFSNRTRITVPGDLNMTAFGDAAYLGVDSVGVNASTKLQSAEINLVETERFFNFLAGFRYIELAEQALIQTNDAVFGNGLANIRTYNKLLGGQAGVRAAHTWGLMGLEGQGKLGMFYNDSSSMTNANDPGSGFTTAQRADGQNETFLGELQIMLTIRSTSAWQYRLGYNAMWLTQTALAIDQIRSDAATGQTLNSKSDLFMHGPFAGAELRW